MRSVSTLDQLTGQRGVMTPVVSNAERLFSEIRRRTDWQQLEGRVRTIDCEVIEDFCEALGAGLTDVVELQRGHPRQ